MRSMRYDMKKRAPGDLVFEEDGMHERFWEKILWRVTVTYQPLVFMCSVRFFSPRRPDSRVSNAESTGVR